MQGNSVDQAAQPPQQVALPIPDVIIPAQAIERMLAHLSNPAVWVRDQAGVMHGFVDPMPIMNTIREHMFAELRRQGLM
jgi:hypothetical protein